MLVDSHCHLDFADFADELDAVVERAVTAGVGAMLTICTRPSELDRNLAIAERYPQVFCAVGVHPHHAAAFPDIDADSIVAMVDHPLIVGIGETGLDYHYDHSPRDVQQTRFRSHIRAARETGLPLIVHTREAEADTIRILQEEGAGDGKLRGVMHCFSGTRDLADRSLDLGFHISFSGILTFNRAEDLRSIARDLPPDRLLVETDAPYLAPVPRRGKRNEPAYVAHTAARLAEATGRSPDDIARLTTANFHTLFSKVPAPVTA